LARVWVLCEAFLGHLERRVFPGGCFFATVSAQLASRPGRPRDRVMELQAQWLGQFATALGQAVDAGELPRGADVGQVVFEVSAMLVRASFTWIVTGDSQVLGQARTGIRHALERAGGTPAMTPGRPKGGGRDGPRADSPRPDRHHRSIDRWPRTADGARAKGTHQRPTGRGDGEVTDARNGWGCFPPAAAFVTGPVVGCSPSN
jgi:hypothetical protein